MRHALVGKKILVTGGTGFIGGRIVEKLVHECNANVRVLLRNYARALRIARYPVEMIYGDLNDLGDVTRAAEGCEMIVHCAYGNSGEPEARRAVNVLGTKNVLEAALGARVRRLVHLSTIQVYGPLSDGDLDETAPRGYWRENYSDTKHEAENLVIEYHRQHGLEAVILQPTAVYGPYSLIWTESILKNMQRERQILVEGGVGWCNAVYVDDVAEAAILACSRDEAVGQSFLISAAEPVTWKDFYGAYERMLGMSATVEMSAVEAEKYDAKRQGGGPSLFKEFYHLMREEPAFRERILASREMAVLKSFASSVLSEARLESMKCWLKGENGGSPPLNNDHAEERPIRLLKWPLDVKYYKTRVRVRIDKARRLLGYEPAFDLAAGMKLTEQWARWANLLADDRRPTTGDRKKMTADRRPPTADRRGLSAGKNRSTQR